MPPQRFAKHSPFSAPGTTPHFLSVSNPTLPVFHFFYRWLHERSQRRESFKLPPDASGKIGLGFGDYIRGQSRSGSLGAYDLLNRRKKRLKIAGIVVLLCLVGWLSFELIYAIRFYGS